MGKSKVVIYGGGFILFVIAFGIIASVLLPKDTEVSVTSAPSHTLAPEMLVKPVHGKFLAACQSKELLQELLRRGVAHEKTKFEAMFDGVTCTQIPESETFKILSVSDGMAEIVNTTAKIYTAEGMWTVQEALQPK